MGLFLLSITLMVCALGLSPYNICDMAQIKTKRIPDYHASGFDQMTWFNLRQAGLGDTDLAFTDVDGVIRPYHAHEIPSLHKKRIEDLGARGIDVATYTNASMERIEELRTDRMLGDVIPPERIMGSFDRPELKKPRGDGIAELLMKWDYHNIVFVGDQIFSDVTAVYNAREILKRLSEQGEPTAQDIELLSILVPMYGKVDNFWVKTFRRPIEAEIKRELGLPTGAHVTMPGIHRLNRPDHT